MEKNRERDSWRDVGLNIKFWGENEKKMQMRTKKQMGKKKYN